MSQSDKQCLYQRSKSSRELKYLIFLMDFMCEMIDEIEIEHLRMALARTRKEANPQPKEEKPLTVVAQ